MPEGASVGSSAEATVAVGLADASGPGPDPGGSTPGFALGGSTSDPALTVGDTDRPTRAAGTEADLFPPDTRTTARVDDRLARAADSLAPTPADGVRLGSYTIRRRLGRGGVGVVFEAYDDVRNATIALKLLENVNPASLHRFKKEFRARADLQHPNLIRLYELYAREDCWFFTMDLVEGVHFLDALRAEPPEVPGGPSVAPDGDRVRALFGQLAAGLTAIHSAGMLHRDIKSFNVMVRPGGEVVILDFGLVVDLDEISAADGAGEIAGTIDYMSPEQALGGPLAASSDWYSFGVLLYEALTGRRPHPSGRLGLLRERQRTAPPAPSTLRAGIPGDLEELCLALLAYRPEARPAGAEVLGRLARSGDQRIAGPAAVPRAGLAFVGRAAELDRLTGLLAEVAAGRTSAAFVAGPSGSGKSSLVARFLDVAAPEVGAVVLRGRCFEQESVPYKAIDGVAEALARHLRRLPPEEVEPLLPEFAGALPYILPALGRVEVIEQRQEELPVLPTPTDLRRRAFAAFGGLITRLARRHPIVVAIDDLQWGDLDSAQLLIELLLTAPPRVLLLGTQRSDFESPGACLTALRNALGAGTGCARHDLVIAPLAEAEARELAARALEDDGPDREVRIGAIVRESRGDPFTILELARHVEPGGGRGGPGPVAAGGVLADRIAGLPAPTRRLLEIVALAGRPIAQRHAYDAAELVGDAWPALMALRDARLAISNGLQPDDEVVTAHDRVRATVVGLLDPTLKSRGHGRLARALERSPEADPETIAAHFLGAEQFEAAGRYYEAAAGRASASLAFNRAAKFYDLAANLRTLDGEADRAFRLKHAEALANAGRSGPAGQAYRRLGEEARADRRDPGDLLHRAAYQLTIGGLVDDGRAIWRSVLADQGIALPDSAGGAIRSLIWEMIRLKLGGLRSRERPVALVPPPLLAKVDLLWSASSGLGMIEPIAAHVLRIQGLRLALRSGEICRIANGLSSYAAILSYAGASARPRITAALDRAADLANRSGDPYALAWHAASSGFVHFHDMRLREALADFERADKILAERCPGVIWEGDTCRSMKLWSRALLCDMGQVAGEWEIHRNDAFERGNLYAQYTLEVMVGPVVRMARDEPEEARLAMSEQMAHWPRERFQIQHLCWIQHEVQIDRYVGDGAAALRRLDAEWSTLKRSMAFHSQLSRTVLIFNRGLAAAMVARTSPRPQPLLRVATRDARRLLRERWDLATAYAMTILSAVALQGGRPAEAISRLERAGSIYESAGLVAPASATRRRAGEIIGGAAGAARVAEADRLLQEMGVKNPQRFGSMYAP